MSTKCRHVHLNYGEEPIGVGMEEVDPKDWTDHRFYTPDILVTQTITSRRDMSLWYSRTAFSKSAASGTVAQGHPPHEREAAEMTRSGRRGGSLDKGDTFR